MSLPDDYLRYPKRGYGMDQTFYPWRPVGARKPVFLPGEKQLGLAVIVPVEHHGLTPSGKPFKHPGAMVTPYPDLRHYTTRDYGNRVGIFRILRELSDAGISATVPINAAALERFGPLVDVIQAEGHRLAAYGLSTDHVHWGGLAPETEAAWIAEVRARFERIGLSPRIWMSPARNQSFVTLSLLARHGFNVCLDWEQDDVPVEMVTDAGGVRAFPLSNELDDRTLLVDRRQTEDEWADQILAAVDALTCDHARFGARVLGFTLTPYVTGQPFRIAALRRVLQNLGRDPRILSAPADSLVDLFAG